MSDMVTWERLAAYWAGECGPTDAGEIERWIAAHPERAELVARLKLLWDAHGVGGPTVDAAAVDSAWHAFQRVAAAESRAPRPAHRPEIAPRRVGRIGTESGKTWRSSAIAAALLVALGLGLAIRAGTRGASLTSRGHEYATVAGQRLSITLADGTRATLAPMSRLRIAADYGREAGTARDVELDGEAYFAVAHDAAHPFAVHAGGAVARDVGTTFDMRAYPEDVGARIAVAEGAVAVSRAAVRAAPLGTLITAGAIATVSKDGVAVEHGADVASLTGWTRGELVFQDAPLRDVILELARWYGADIRLGDPAIGERHVRGTIRDESVTAALDLVVQAVGARYERRGGRVTIYGATERRGR